MTCIRLNVLLGSKLCPYHCSMNKQEVIFSRQATQMLSSIVYALQEVSLLSAEKVRAKFFHKFHLIQHHPLQSSKPVALVSHLGHIRMTTVLNYKIYYKVEATRIIILDILLDKVIAQKI